MRAFNISKAVLMPAAIGVMLCLNTGLSAQEALTITSPANNAVVHSGDSFPVVVSVPTGVKPLSVVVGFGDPGFGKLPALTAPPFRWTATVQTNTFGTKKLQAFVDTGGAEGSISPSIMIDAEPSNPPVSLIIRPGRIGFFFVGENRSLSVGGISPDGSTGDLTLSTYITYSSSNTAVASVNNAGEVIAKGSGSGSDMVFYNGANPQTVAVSVPKSISGDLNGDGQVDIDDVNILNSYLNTPASGPNDARDLNHDGRIDALDARILTTFCTYARCATHP